MNVLLYVFDALRADHVGVHGYDLDTTRALDSLAADGVVFEQCITPSTWTRPVAASILSGLYPPVHGTRGRLSSYEPPVPSLPKHFQKSGHQTAMIGSMPNIRPEFGFDRGFDHYHDVYTDPRVEEERGELRPGVPQIRAEDLTRGILEWFDNEYSANSFFMMAWSYETHAPYDPPEGYRDFIDPEYDGDVDGTPESFSDVSSQADRKHLKSLYDGCVDYNDDCLGDIMSGLRDRGLYEDTLIICIGDHGDGHGEHPGFFGHGITPYEGLVHVPCIARTPNDVAGHRFESVSSLIDLYPSLLDACDIEIGEQLRSSLQGVSLSGALSGEKHRSSDRRVFVDGDRPHYESQASYHVAREDQWKLIDLLDSTEMTSGRNLVELARDAVTSGKLPDILRNPFYYWNRQIGSNETMLFDLESDLGEQSNLVESRLEKREQLEHVLDEWRAECSELNDYFDVEPEEITINSGSKQRLQALGYLKDE